ncbi:MULTISPECIES: DUF1573 domain-containing protein [unclassified Flavobacterium]|uniref:DUF1573 domain-containing protein n=1 Tax=unclassified Flavobacterium TaxID=196869 RepID=UPI0009685327|nr:MULTISPECIES: DUF1573 domain-containing protein [unclassified Flavobacterium]MBN9284887.1 DUF1573 domain-containing protein [Flavobacterium sp.]OJV72199.1 MAG: hypothetical protein BGO42_03160 [Flavobacterium sp. 40-81]
MKRKIIEVSVVCLVLVIAICYIGKCREWNNVFSLSNATIEVVNTFDFESMHLKDTLKHTFLIKNTSDNVLNIVAVHSNCGCTITSFSREKIKKGESAEIAVTFVPQQVGRAEKSIVVEANTAPPYTVLSLHGIVKK